MKCNGVTMTLLLNKFVLILASILLSLASYVCLSELHSNSTTADCKTLYLLNVVPYPDDSPFAGWDPGFDLIPAGLVAANQINNRSDVLDGYELKLINTDSEACGRSIITKGLVNFYQELVYSDSKCIMGVVGLYCSTVTSSIAPIANHPNIDYVVFTSSTSPQLRDNEHLPHTFFSIASSSVYIGSIVSMMNAFSWKKISVVHDSLGFFFRSTGNAFGERIKSERDFELVSSIPITASSQLIPEIFDIFLNQEARVSFWAVTAGQAANSLCEAYRRKLLWPGFVYIFQEHYVVEFLSVKTECTYAEMLQAVEGIVFINPKLVSNGNKTLVSDITFDQYHDKYLDELDELSRVSGINNSDNIWAHSLYDQVWAFALALNSSLVEIDSLNMTLSDYRIGKTTAITRLISNKLEQLSFQGASGFVQFGKDHQVKTFVEIFQVRNGTDVLVGVYNPYENNITFVEDFEVIPKDTFEVINNLFPLPLGLAVFAVQGVLCVLMTLNLVMLMYRRKTKEVKALSPFLSVLMFLGCYLMCAVPVIQLIYKVIVIQDSILFTALCNLEYWLLLNGINLIFATLFVRLLRIFHIFRAFQKTGKFWSDKFLFLYTILICSVQACMLIIWTIVNPPHKGTANIYVPTSNPPHYETTAFCTGDNLGVWVTLSFTFTGLIVAMVIFLAIQTRHIKKHHFKDTKKVNAFVFIVLIILTISISLDFLLSSIGLELVASIVKWVAYLSVPLLCQVLLFVPRTLPCFSKYLSRYETEDTTRKMPAPTTTYLISTTTYLY